MPTDTSEFIYLPAQAATLGVSLPAAERVEITLPSGRTLSALRYGTDTPRVTFLHGAGLNAHTWDTTVLLTGQPALVIDLPGHGDSSWRDDARYLPSLLADDVAAGISAWTTQPQVLVGQSLGGLTAAVIAATHPDLVAAVITVDITPGVDTRVGPSELQRFFSGPTDFASRDELVERAMAFGFGGSRADTERGVFFNSRIRDDGRVEWKHHFAHLVAAAANSEKPAPSAVLDEDGWGFLARVTAPITLVRGIRGYITDENLGTYRERMPHATVIELDATHNVQESAPRELADIITDRLPS